MKNFVCQRRAERRRAERRQEEEIDGIGVIQSGPRLMADSAEDGGSSAGPELMQSGRQIKFVGSITGFHPAQLLNSRQQQSIHFHYLLFSIFFHFFPFFSIFFHFFPFFSIFLFYDKTDWIAPEKNCCCHQLHTVLIILINWFIHLGAQVRFPSIANNWS